MTSSTSDCAFVNITYKLYRNTFKQIYFSILYEQGGLGVVYLGWCYFLKKIKSIAVVKHIPGSSSCCSSYAMWPFRKCSSCFGSWAWCKSHDPAGQHFHPFSPPKVQTLWKELDNTGSDIFLDWVFSLVRGQCERLCVWATSVLEQII